MFTLFTHCLHFLSTLPVSHTQTMLLTHNHLFLSFTNECLHKSYGKLLTHAESILTINENCRILCKRYNSCSCTRTKLSAACMHGFSAGEAVVLQDGGCTSGALCSGTQPGVSQKACSTSSCQACTSGCGMQGTRGLHGGQAQGH